MRKPPAEIVASLLAAQCVILFSLNAGQMLLARVPGLGLGFIPGMFFGFASSSGMRSLGLAHPALGLCFPA